MTRRRRPPSSRDYPRTARLNRLIQQIVAEELERVEDDRLELVTVMAVEVDADLHQAVVWVDSLAGEAGDEAVIEALGELRPRLQAEVNRQARIKRTPELVFRPDEVLRGANRVDDILRGLASPADDPDGDDTAGDPADDTADDDPTGDASTGA